MRDTEILLLDDESVADVADRVAAVLQGEGVCIVPTDTLYGIIALDEHVDSVRYIHGIKKRPEGKPFIRLIGGLETLKRYTDQVPPPLLARHWPGPLTLIFKNRSGGTIAVRYPDDAFLAQLFDRIGNRAIVAPSANLSGERDIFDCDCLNRTFGGLVDMIVCREGGPRCSKASTIVDITGDRPRVIRRGAVEL
jgi:L-threonylcarbamoyladenylate synthase